MGACEFDGTPSAVVANQTFHCMPADSLVCVEQVRETSRKPDEMYPLLERLSPGTRKLEIFARQHNVKPGWVCLGNQLAGINIKEPDMQARFDATYPNGLD